MALCKISRDWNIYISNKQKILLAEAATFAIQYFDIKKPVHITLRKREWLGLELGHAKYVGNKYIIQLNLGLVFWLDLKTLFHEMTHIKQRIRGELLHTQGQSFWNNEPISHKTKYRKLPQEIDARYYENKLFWLFIIKRVLK